MSNTRKRRASDVGDGGRQLAKKQVHSKFVVTQKDVDALVQDNMNSLVSFASVRTFLETEEAFWDKEHNRVDPDVSRAARYFHLLQLNVCDFVGEKSKKMFDPEDSESESASYSLSGSSFDGDAMDLDNVKGPKPKQDVSKGPKPRQYVSAAQEDFLFTFESFREFLLGPRMELTDEECSNLMSTVADHLDGKSLLEQCGRTEKKRDVGRGDLEEACDKVFELEGEVKRQMKIMRTDPVTGYQLEGLRICFAMLKLAELTQKQLLDARNVAFRMQGKMQKYPPSYEAKGKSIQQSEKEMKERKPIILGWFRHCLEILRMY